MKPIVLNPPSFQTGQRVVIGCDEPEPATVCGVSYALEPSPYDWAAGWCYTVNFDNPKLDPDTFHESFVASLEVASKGEPAWR